MSLPRFPLQTACSASSRLRRAGRGLAHLGVVIGLAIATEGYAAEDVMDRLDQALTWAGPDPAWRARVSGLLDLEGYALPHPAPGVIDAGASLFNPRLTVFLDAQAGEQLYVFAQARADRGFDPVADPATARLDEYAIRWTPVGSRRFTLQVGKFATVVGNWTPRHDSWTNPFITAPLPYENLTGIWDNEPPHSASQLLVWSHVRPGLTPAVIDEEKYLRLPIVWGPSYAPGAALAGEIDRFRYALEVKSVALSSRPDAWTSGNTKWDHPAVSGRVRYLPNEQWEFGWSASSGSFLRPFAVPLPGYSRGDYREIVLGQDVTYAWHHLQVWGEIYAARFKIPVVGNADTLAYYAEVKYKVGPQWAWAMRWNQQLFGTVVDRGVDVRWGHALWRADLAAILRLTPHAQLKVQYSVQPAEFGSELKHLLAGQATLRW